MKISLFTGGHARYPLSRAFEIAAEVGYDGVDIGGMRPHAYAPDLERGGADQIKALSDKYQLPIVSYIPENTGSPHSLVFEDKQMNRESLDYFKLTLRMAKEIGAQYCMFACNHPGYGRKLSDVRKLFLNNLRELVDYAESIQQTIILEPVTPYEGRIVISSDDVLWALSEVKSDYLKCVLDLACPLTYHEPLSEYFEKLGEDIVELHFIDALQSSEDHLIPGDGEIDFEKTVRYLKKVGFDGYLCLELFSRYDNEPDFAAARGFEVISNLIK